MLLLGILFGFSLGYITFNHHNDKPAPELAQVIEKVSEITANTGAKVTISRTTSEGKTEESNTSSSSKGESKNNFWRLFGPDSGANQAASRLAPNKFDGTEIGGSRNYGVLEQVWEWIRNWLWTIGVISVLFFLALGVMFFIPATSGIAATIFQWIMSVVPVIGSAIVGMFSKIKFTKQATATTEIVVGVEDFKKAVAAEPFIVSDDLRFVSTDNLVEKAANLTTRIQTRVKTLFKLANNDVQGDNAKSIVSTILNQ
jgi:hypothetical protein